MNLGVLGASEKVVPVPLPACAFAYVDSSVDSYGDSYANSYVNSPDTTVLFPVSVLAPVTWGCNKDFAGYSALVSLCQIDRTQVGQQPGPGANLRGEAAEGHQVGLEQANLWQVDSHQQPKIWDGMAVVGRLETWFDLEVWEVVQGGRKMVFVIRTNMGS